MEILCWCDARRKSSKGSDSDWHPVEIPTLNHILETPHPKRCCVQGSWGAGWTGRSFTESIFNHSMTWGQTLLSWKVGLALMTRDSEPLRPCDAVFPPAPITEPTAAAASADPANGQNFHLHQELFFLPSSLEPSLTLTSAGTRKMNSPTFLVRGCQMTKTLDTWHHRRRIPYSVI